jgi:hypothetical protein
MNSVPRQTLRRILAKYGNDLCGDARRCEALLKDLCGEYRREINVLTSAIEERIPLDLLAAVKTMPRDVLFIRLAKRLEDNLGLTKDASVWAIESWAFALNIITEAEIAANEKTRSNRLPTQLPPKTTQPDATPNNINAARGNQPQTPQFPKQTPPKPQPPKIYPPIARTPATLPMPSPKMPPQKSGANVNVPQNPAQSNNPASNPVPQRRFGRFFGCLFVFFLFVVTGVVLFFGVPYAINVMRETQQTEPPRFPQR